MKLKGIPLKIFIIVLISGLIGIGTNIILKYDIDRLSDNYAEITEEHTVNIDYMGNISNLLYQHQSIVSSHVVAVEENIYEKYENRLSEIEEKLDELMVQFKKRMAGEEREQLFHNVYSTYQSYKENARIAIKFSRSGSTSTAEYYVTNILFNYIETVNGKFDELNALTIREMQEARDRMNYYIRFSHLCANISMGVIFASSVLCVFYSVKITSSLERYKDSLEEEVEQKTGDLRRHNEKMLELQNNIIIGMANLIESRDGDTGEHVKRTSKYVSMLAEKARSESRYSDTLDDAYIELLVKAAPMHDIGKIAVPDNILQKPGKLTPEEFEQVKNHAPMGGKIIHDVLGNIEEKEYVDIAAMVAAHHHEKWDGSGYPDGLSGDDIPLCARIMAIADVFDALVSKRCYKDAMPLDVAFGIIQDSAGSHFDPVLADIFMRLRPEIEAYLMGTSKNLLKSKWKGGIIKV